MDDTIRLQSWVFNSLFRALFGVKRSNGVRDNLYAHAQKSAILIGSEHAHTRRVKKIVQEYMSHL